MGEMREKSQLTGDGMTGVYVETEGGLWWLSDDLCEQIRAEKQRQRLNWIMWGRPMTFCGLPVVWQEDRQERVDYSVNRAARRRRGRGKQ